MLSFAAIVNALLLILSIVALHAPRTVAGAPANATLRLDSPLVSFTPGWKAATFTEDGSEFAFADGLNEEVRITLPAHTTDVFYRGYRVAGGALFLACVDCVVDAVRADLVGVNFNAVVVNAHDSTENGTQPADTLFSFTNLDPTTDHVLIVFNLEDPVFNDTSQVTFDSVVVTTDPQAGGGNSTATSSGVIVVPNLPTLTVTAIEPASTGTDSSTTTAPIGHGPISTDTGSGTATSSGLPGATITFSSSTSTSAIVTDTTRSEITDSTTTQTATTSAGSTGSGDPGTSSAQSPGASPTNIQTTAASQPGQSGSGTPTPTDPSGTGTGGTNTVISNPPNESSQPTANSDPSNGTAQPTGSSPTGASGEGTPLPSVSPVFSPLPPAASGTSTASNSGASTTGVSKPVIIAIAIVASLIVLALLGAVFFVLVRNRASPPLVDWEGQAGLTQEAAPAAMVSAPTGLAPMRPQNPFADTVAPDIPLDASLVDMEGADEVGEVEEVLAQPQPSLPPPPVPPKSPLRGTFSGSPRNSPWLSRVPRNSASTPS